MARTIIISDVEGKNSGQRLVLMIDIINTYYID